MTSIRNNLYLIYSAGAGLGCVGSFGSGIYLSSEGCPDKGFLCFIMGTLVSLIWPIWVPFAGVAYIAYPKNPYVSRNH